MKTIEISQATDSLGKYARELNGDSVVLTQNHMPVAALVPLKDPRSRKAPDPVFLQMIQEARESFRKYGGISEDELRRQLGLPPAKKTQSPRRSNRKPNRR